MDSVTVGKAIRAARGERPQRVIADALGISQPQVSALERGDRFPRVDELAAIEEACGRARGWVLRSAGLIDDATSVPEAIAIDPALSEAARDMLLAAYQAAIAQHATSDDWALAAEGDQQKAREAVKKARRRPRPSPDRTPE